MELKPGKKAIGNTMLPIDELGITKIQSSRWQREATLGNDEFAALVAKCNDGGIDKAAKKVVASAERLSKCGNVRMF